jgi:hypothetical protein
MLKYIMLVLLSTSIAYSQDKPKTGGPDPIPNRPRPKLTEEQKKVQAELVSKYDINKDGKLDREERQKISEEDRKKLRQSGLGPRRPEGPNKPKGPRKEKTEEKSL